MIGKDLRGNKTHLGHTFINLRKCKNNHLYLVYLKFDFFYQPCLQVGIRSLGRPVFQTLITNVLTYASITEGKWKEAGAVRVRVGVREWGRGEKTCV